ncbi:MAG: two-component regulator propeller domain-containing protein [Saprospiraceae bacterium]
MKKFAIYLAIILPAIYWVPAFGQTVIANYKQQIGHPAIANEGNVIWVGSAGEGVMKCDLSGNLLERYTSSNGLSGNTVYDIVIDQQGRRWFATDGGISILTDANIWIHLSAVWAKSFDLASNGNIWATGGNKVYEFELQTLTMTTISLAYYFGSTIKIGSDNTIYVCGDQGLAIKSPLISSWAYYLTFSDPFDDETITDLEFDGQGNLWVIKGSFLFTFSNGIYTPVFGNLVNNLPILGSQNAHCLEQLPNGNLLISSSNGFWIYNGTPTVEEYKRRPGFSAVQDFSVVNDSTFWFSCGQGFSYFHGNEFDHFSPDNHTLSAENVFKILVDENEKKWFLGTFARTEFDNTLWETHSNNSFEDPIARPTDALFEPNGTKWFINVIGGSSNAHLVRLRNDTIHFFVPPAPGIGHFTRLAWDPIKKRAIVKTKLNAKDFWYFENDSIKSFEITRSGNLCFWGFNWGCSNSNKEDIRHFFISAEGNYVWASQIGYLYSHWGYSAELMQDTFVYSCWDYRDPCPAPYWENECACNNTNYVAFDSLGRIWFASDIGVYIYNNFEDNTQLRYGVENSGLPNDTVQCIAFDAMGRAWIGTRNGLAILGTDLNWDVLTVNNSGLAGNNIRCITFDLDGTAWVGTTTGVTHMSITTGIKEVPENPNTLTISPNPASETITVVAPDGAWGNLKFYTCTGSLIETVSNVVPGQQYTFEVRLWPPGIYFVTATTQGRGMRTGRLIVQR